MVMLKRPVIRLAEDHDYAFHVCTRVNPSAFSSARDQTHQVSDAVIGASVVGIQIQLFVLDPRAIGQAKLQTGNTHYPIR